MAKKRILKPISPFAKSLGARLKNARKALHLSQDQLAESLGVTFQQIHHYETGKSNLCGEKIAEICRALKIEPNDLFGWHPHKRIFVFGETLAVLDWDAYLASRWSCSSANQS